MAKRIVDQFKEEMERLEQNIKDLEAKRAETKEKIRKPNGKKYAAIKAGDIETARKYQKQIDDIYEEVHFLDDTIETAKEFMNAQVHEEVLKLIEYREERKKINNEKFAKIKKDLLKAKYEYLKQIKKLYREPFNEIRKEMNELNDLIKKYGNPKLMPQPNMLKPVEYLGYVTYGRYYYYYPVVKESEIKEILNGVTSARLALYEEFGIFDGYENENQAKELLKQKRAERDGGKNH